MTTASMMDADVTREELLRRASALVPVLKERAARTEQLRQIPPETVQDLLASDLHRVAVPRRYGGLDVGYDIMLEAGCELGRGCGATAWCYSLWSAHAWLIGHWPAPAQEDVFAGGADVLCSSSFAPGGATAEPVAGGFRLSGRWEFSSGCDAARWLMLGAPGPAGPMWVLVPRSDYEIIDTWFVSGLCGTGSKDIAISDAFVPGYRTLIDPFRAGERDETSWELHQQTQYRLPMRCLLGWDLVTPLIGIAQGAVDEFTDRFRGTSGPGRSAESIVIQLRLAEAAAEVDAARALLRQDIQQMLTKAACGESFTPLEIARYQRDRAFVTQLCVQAVTRLFEVSGGHALFSSDPLQRMYRDAIAVSHRDGYILDFGGQPYGRIALALEHGPGTR
jgi:alkylation response protein AidB-like acyl-CoA dehydrogenase